MAQGPGFTELIGRQEFPVLPGIGKEGKDPLAVPLLSICPPGPAGKAGFPLRHQGPSTKGAAIPRRKLKAVLAGAAEAVPALVQEEEALPAKGAAPGKNILPKVKKYL
jgi:hypothetical protein